jgi:hypothetical protein
MTPEYEYFRKQLKRMRAGDPKVDVPPETGTSRALRSVYLPQ